VIVSRFPILAVDYYVYTEGSASDSLSAKGVLYTKIEMHEYQAVHCITTHLQASYSSREKEREKFERIRVSQLLELQEFVQKKTKNDCHPIVLVGDMNTNMELTPNAGSPQSEYDIMIKTLSSKYFTPVDVLFHLYGHRPVTGFSEKITKLEVTDLVQNTPVEWRSLDYILLLIRKNYNTVLSFQVLDLGQTKSSKVEKPATNQNTHVTSVKGTKEIRLETRRGLLVEIEGSVEYFRTPEGSLFTTLSDHFGVAMIVKLRKIRESEPCPLELSNK